MIDGTIRQLRADVREFLESAEWNWANNRPAIANRFFSQARGYAAQADRLEAAGYAPNQAPVIDAAGNLIPAEAPSGTPAAWLEALALAARLADIEFWVTGLSGPAYLNQFSIAADLYRDGLANGAVQITPPQPGRPVMGLRFSQVKGD